MDSFPTSKAKRMSNMIIWLGIQTLQPLKKGVHQDLYPFIYSSRKGHNMVTSIQHCILPWSETNKSYFLAYRKPKLPSSDGIPELPNLVLGGLSCPT